MRALIELFYFSVRRPLPYQPLCPVCGDPTVAPQALGIRFEVETGSGEVMAFFRLTSAFQSFPGRIHGGLVSMVMDEAMAWAAAVALQSFCTTGELRVKLKRAVPLVELAVTARVVKTWGKYVRATAALTTCQGICLAVANGTFAALPREVSLSFSDALCFPSGCYDPLSPTA